MLLSDLHGQQSSHGSPNDAACSERASNLSDAGSDDQLIADCRSLMRQIGALLNEIEQTADAKGPEQGQRQASLCDADDKALDLMERIAATRAFTHSGVQSKHAAADFLLFTNWYEEPSPCRDRLLLSFVLDAVRHSYPAMSTDHASVGKDVDATATVIIHANTCLAVSKRVAASFSQKDQDAEHGPVNQDGLDALILALDKQKKTAVEALVRIRAFSVPAISAKRVVLRRMLEAGMYDSDAHHLRVELARSYFSDLKNFFQADAQEQHETLPGHSTIWHSLSSRFRWLKTTVHLR